MALEVTAPVSGAVMPLAEVPDPVFAGALVGPGLAIRPDDDAHVVVAPVAGRLAKVKPHAFVVVDDGGRGVLVHLGIDTVRLNGAGFTVLAAEGEAVACGAPVVRWDPLEVAAQGLSPICPVVALDAPAEAIASHAEGHVSTGDALFVWN